MNPAQIRIHPWAEVEIVEAYRWYRARSLLAAVAFRAQLDRAIALIAEAPERQAAYLQGTRRVLVRRFPFSVIYRTGDGGVEIVAVAHGRRRPGYWADR